MKKFLSLCLALVMVFALFCVTASAEEPTGKVMLYSSMQEDQLMAVEKAFEAKYPGIDMEYFYAGGGKREQACEQCKENLFHILQI